MNTNIHYITDFLNEAEVKDISHSIYNIPRDWWYLSMKPTDADYRSKNFRDRSEITDSDEFNQAIKHVNNVYEDGWFCHRFYRDLNDHYDTCNCGVCRIKNLFNSDEVKYKIEQIIGKKVKKFNETFVSKYEKDNFVTVHHDKGNGDYAFTYQMTPEWNVIHGGLLTFCNENNIYKVVTPKFNSLTIFKIKDEIITDHFVSKVTGNKTRVAYTGWFSVE
jgi:Rps23 Pro-64 3,4-dihydroxylase Tpa1-like proline 4-hydroxylase